MNRIVILILACGLAGLLAPATAWCQAGTIVVWGTDLYGHIAMAPSTADFVAIEGGWFHSLGLREDGSIATWGETANRVLEVPAPNAGFGRHISGTDAQPGSQGGRLHCGLGIE